MGNLAAWLLAMVGPVVARGLASLGIVWLTYQGVETLADSVRSEVLGLWNGLPDIVLRFAQLTGLSGAVGIMLGALAARAALVAVARLGKKP